MNTLLTIMYFALIASVVAKPGYNYQEPKAQVVQQSLGPVGQQQFVGPAQQYISPVQQQNVGQYQQTNYQPQPQTIYQPQQQQTTYQPQQQQVIVSKDIFIHSAPEEYEEINNEQHIEPSPIRKNYRIVFVKAPSHNIRLNLASYKRAQASNEEKTVIYVLSKKPDFATIQSQLTDVQSEPKTHKPEVYFIKYKTQEEANRAQQEIQAQYDSLGGATHISDEGIAPITSVIDGGRVSVGSIGSSLNGGSVSSVGPSFTDGHSGSAIGGGAVINGGSVGTSFGGGNIGSGIGGGAVNIGSIGSSFTDGNALGGGSIVQTSSPIQQSYQSGQSSSNFVGAPSQNYLPVKKN